MGDRLGTAVALYASRLSSFGATYGSLGAVVAVMLRFYVSAYAALLGAEANARLEEAYRGQTRVADWIAVRRERVFRWLSGKCKVFRHPGVCLQPSANKNAACWASRQRTMLN